MMGVEACLLDPGSDEGQSSRQCLQIDRRIEEQDAAPAWVVQYVLIETLLRVVGGCRGVLRGQTCLGDDCRKRGLGRCQRAVWPAGHFRP
ncbi:hypothetical protein D3C77_687590 [compost metagenome]